MLLTERIKRLAEPLGITFAKLERDAGLGRGTIRKWDNNCPSADKLFRVANLLHTSMDYLMGNDFSLYTVPNSEDEEWIEMIHRLPKEKQYELKGYLKRMLEEAGNIDSTGFKAN